MKLVFFWNFLNNHQVWVADELFKLLGDDFKFVTTLPINVEDLKGGIDYSGRPYCIVAPSSDGNHRLAINLAKETDVCVFGACSQEYAVVRAKENPRGLSFECGERWLKKGFVNMLSPNFIKWRFNYHRYFRKANFYKLCSSAYAKQDDELMGGYKERHFKWGYFTKSENFRSDVRQYDHVRIMWCARFIPWKNPKVPLRLAQSLKKNNYRFVIDMYGDGELKGEVMEKAERMDVADVVHFHGNKPNHEILEAMHCHDIFLFTSNRREGWGAVLNESMMNGCCPVASNMIGSVPYLIKDSENGLIYNGNDFDSLYEKMKFLLDNPQECRRMGENAASTLCQIWSPVNAAKNLCMLSSSLLFGQEFNINDGPCSKA